MFLTRRDAYCKKTQKVNLRKGITFVVVVVVSAAVVNTLTEYFRNGLSAAGIFSFFFFFFYVFNACNKLFPESTYQNDRQQS